MEIILNPIGILHTPFYDLNQMPVQPGRTKRATGHAEIFDAYLEGLQGLETFTHVILIYHFHQQEQTMLRVIPFLGDTEMGLFATRAPARPNKIGLSVVEVEMIEGNRVFFKNPDMVNGSPLLDIKPYVPRFDHYPDANNGWLEGKINVDDQLSDNRFAGV
jgi:tRNA-Thr(GGU) m(6)t(6)A37 methyltransferase TsaA